MSYPSQSPLNPMKNPPFLIPWIIRSARCGSVVQALNDPQVQSALVQAAQETDGA